MSGGACASNPCKNGATCVNVGGATNYRCICMENYSGSQCDTDIITLPADVQQNLSLVLYGSGSFATMIFRGPTGSRIRFDLFAMSPEMCENVFLNISLGYPDMFDVNCLQSARTTIYTRSNVAGVDWISDLCRQSVFVTTNSSADSSYVILVEASRNMLLSTDRIPGRWPMANRLGFDRLSHKFTITSNTHIFKFQMQVRAWAIYVKMGPSVWK